MESSTMRIIKAIAAVLAIIGVNVSPENQTLIGQAFLAVYTIASGVQHKLSKKE